MLRRESVVAVILAMLIAACGDSVGVAEPPATTPATAAPAATTPPTSTTSTTPEPAPTEAPSTTTTGVSTACPDDPTQLGGDLDGDGRQESIVVDQPIGAEATINVCQSELVVIRHSLGELNKPLQVYVVDIESDGVDELLVGGATGRSPFVGSVMRAEGSELVDLRVFLEVSSDDRSGTSFGCVDVDDDGRTELVTLAYEFDADSRGEATSVDWTRTVVFDGIVTNGPTTTGTFDVAAQPNAIRALVNGTCGEDTLIRLF